MNEDYKPKIEKLMRKHQLGFLYNPGGGEFTHDHPKLRKPCQVSAMGDYKEDYGQLIKHLAEAGMEPAHTATVTEPILSKPNGELSGGPKKP